MNDVPRSLRLPKPPVSLSREALAGTWPKAAGKSSSSRTGFFVSLGLHGCLAAAACSLVWLAADGNGSGGVSVEGEAGEMVMGLMPDAAESSDASSTSTPAPRAMPMPVVQLPVFSNHVDLPPPQRWTANVPAAKPSVTTVVAATPSDRTGTSDNLRGSKGGNSSGKGRGNRQGPGQGGGGNSIAQKPPSGPPKLIDAPPPRYPAAAKSAGKSGQVRVLVQVRGNGTAASTSLYHGSGDAALDNAAVAAARSWKFSATPSLGTGQTIPVVVKVNFRL